MIIGKNGLGSKLSKQTPAKSADGSGVMLMRRIREAKQLAREKVANDQLREDQTPPQEIPREP